MKVSAYPHLQQSHIFSIFLVVLINIVSGCDCRNYGSVFGIKGRLVDSAGHELANLVFDARVIVNDESIVEFDAMSSNVDGEFAIDVITQSYVLCQVPHQEDPPRVIPRGIILVPRSGGCIPREISLVIDADSVTDPDFDNNIAEFANPIVIEKCE